MKEEKNLKFLSEIHGEKCWPWVDKLSPCEKACPIHTDIPSYIMAISQGKFKEALAVIRETNPFPSVCGRVCHHPCEMDCNRSLLDEPIAIRGLKRFVADYELKAGQKPAPVKRTKKEKVAVIGSGPAGLTAAYDLIQQGYGVTVYEALPFAGGMLNAGIPKFILPREILAADVNYIRALGVEIKFNIRIGDELSLADLSKEGFDAFLLATGSPKSIPLNIPGSDLENVKLALPLLQKVNWGEKVIFEGRVMVIGGGAVAVDIARSVKRLRADEVHMACLEPRKEMPAFPWLIEAAEKEGVIIHSSLAPQRFEGISSEGKKRIIIEFKRVASIHVGAEGQISWTLGEGAGSEYIMEVDSLVIAIGQVPDPSFIGESRVQVSGRGSFIVDPDTLATSVPGVFAAGDAVGVRGTVVDAIATGHRVAQSIQRYLEGEVLKEKRMVAVKEVLKIDPQMAPPWLTRKDRWEMPSLYPKDAVRTFSEVDIGYIQAQAIEEAKRCLNCRMCVNCLYSRNQLCFETGSRIL